MGQKLVEESLWIFQNLGDYYATVWPGLELGNIAVLLREYSVAKECYARVFKGAQEKEYTWGLAKSARYLGSLALLMKDYDEARIYLLQSLRISDDIGLIRDVVNTLYDIARLDENCIGFYLADAVGHSMPAALLTIFLKQAI